MSFEIHTNTKNRFQKCLIFNTGFRGRYFYYALKNLMEPIRSYKTCGNSPTAEYALYVTWYWYVKNCLDNKSFHVRSLCTLIGTSTHGRACRPVKYKCLRSRIERKPCVVACLLRFSLHRAVDVYMLRRRRGLLTLRIRFVTWTCKSLDKLFFKIRNFTSWRSSIGSYLISMYCK